MYVRREIGIQRRKEGISFMRSSWVEVESPNENGNNEGKYCVSFGHCKRWFCVPLFSFSLFFLSSSLLSFSLFFLSFLVNTSIPLINYRLPLSASPLSLTIYRSSFSCMSTQIHTPTTSVEITYSSNYVRFS